MIRFDSVTKYFGTKRALSGLSFEVRRGEILGLVGRNAAGKTTTLNILSGQLLPSTGEVYLEGERVTERPQALRSRIGFLPEMPPLYREMTVRAYLLFAVQIRGVSAAEAPGRVAETIATMGLEEVASDRLGDLSRGFQQRVGIAQAVIHKPPVVLLDEPMAGLDPLQIVQLRELIGSLRGGHTVILSSHLLPEIANVCDRVVLMDQGAVRAIGTEAELRGILAAERRIALLVRGDRAVLKKALEGVQGVEVETLREQGRNLQRATVKCRGDPREALSHACMEAGLGLLEIKWEEDGLEALFLQMIGAEGGTAA